MGEPLVKMTLTGTQSGNNDVKKMVDMVDWAIDISVDHKSFLISSMASNSTSLNLGFLSGHDSKIFSFQLTVSTKMEQFYLTKIFLRQQLCQSREG